MFDEGMEDRTEKRPEVAFDQKTLHQTMFTEGDVYDERDKKSDSLDLGDSVSTLAGSEAMDINTNDVDAIVPVEDYDVPALTLRMWVMSLALSAVVAGIDSFFSLRFPTISIGAIVVQVLAYPIGQGWHYIVPQWTVPLPFGWSFGLNPGPFNQKEHACVYLFANLVTSANLVNYGVIEQFKFFNHDVGIGRMILFNLSCYLIAYSLAGLTLDILVTPVESIWPGTLSTCAMFKAFHSSENRPVGRWTISRYNFFLVVFACLFVWYWFPDLILPFLDNIGGFISWIDPNNATLSQVFSTSTGLGLVPVTFNWLEITSVLSVLTAPPWVIALMFVLFVFWVWIVMPALYYTNKWQTAYFPIMTSNIYDTKGKSYNVSRVVTKDWTLNLQGFRDYSPVMLPIAFLMNLALGLGAFAAAVVAFLFRFKQDVVTPLTKKHHDVHNQALSHYAKLHWGFYVAALLVGLGLGFAYVGAWDDVQIRPAGFFVAVLIGATIFVPIALVEARSSIELSMASFFEVVSAFWFRGQPLTLFYFYWFGFSLLQHAMHASQSAKIAHYMKVPPKHAMIVLFASSVWSAIVSPTVVGLVIDLIGDVCSLTAKNNMTCRKTRTQYNAHLVWGLFGSHLFTLGGRYSWVLWFFLAGAAVAAVISALQMWKPKSFWKHINPTLFFGGATLIPSVTGFNYSTWAITGFIFNFYIHRKHNAWWKKYNLVLSVGMDCGVAIAAIIIFFAVVYTGASDRYLWWGTTVGTTGCNANGCPHLISNNVTVDSFW